MLSCRKVARCGHISYRKDLHFQIKNKQTLEIFICVAEEAMWQKEVAGDVFELEWQDGKENQLSSRIFWYLKLGLTSCGSLDHVHHCGYKLCLPVELDRREDQTEESFGRNSSGKTVCVFKLLLLPWLTHRSDCFAPFHELTPSLSPFKLNSRKTLFICLLSELGAFNKWIILITCFRQWGHTFLPSEY